MNQSYKLVWNAVHQVWVVASEVAKSHKKSKMRLLCTAMCASLAVATAWAAPGIHDLPQLGGIGGGSATITNPAQGQLVVNQTSAKLIANWNSFDVGQQARVDFIQPDSQSIALNRINSALPSQIFGQVNANGRLILVNPSGLVFGAQSQVNAASLVASTYAISDDNFNSDNLLFNRGGSEAGIDNQGGLTASQGNVVLLANSIKNSGAITSTVGNISLVNANQANVASDDVKVTQPSDIAGLIQSTGSLNATRIASFKGSVYLLGNRSREGSKVELAGNIDAKSAQIHGRDVVVSDDLTLKGNTLLDAVNSVHVNAPVNAVSNNRLLSLAYGEKIGNGIWFGAAGKINLSGNNLKYRENNTYYQVVKTLDELQAINTDAVTLSVKYVLGLDIDAAETQTWNSGAGFTPIGQGSAPFTGELNGLGHNIRGLFINLPESSAGSIVSGSSGSTFVDNGVGLFGVAKNSTLKNIRLVDVDITGKANVGGLVGVNLSSLVFNGDTGIQEPGTAFVGYNHVSGEVHGNYSATALCNISVCPNDYDRYSFSGGQAIGGLVGLSKGDGNGLVSNNISTALVSGNQLVGGLIGSAADNIRVLNNSSQGDVSGNVSVGGLIGQVSSEQSTKAVLQANQADVFISGSSYRRASAAGGLVGNLLASDGGRIESRYNMAAGTVSGSFNVGGLFGAIGAYNNYNNVPASTSHINIHYNYATADVSADAKLGGLIGSAAERSSYISIFNTYASGQVDNTAATTTVGGLVGHNGFYIDSEIKNHGIVIKNSYWDADTTGQSSSVGYLNTDASNPPDFKVKLVNVNPVSGGGGSHPNAYSQSSYANFDFGKKWSIVEGIGRPQLQALASNP